jgi:hypothetical protein
VARSTAEIQADIALTRSQIERRLDAIQTNVARRWWVPYALLGAAFVTGLVLSRVPVFRLARVAFSVAQTGIAMAGTMAALGAGAVAAVDRVVAGRTHDAV